MIPALAPLTGGAYKLEELLGIGLPGVEPDDYEIFWRESHVASVRTPLRDERLEVPGTSENHLFEKIFFNTAGGFRIGAWLAIPKKSAPRAVVVHSHGYGELKDPSPDFSDAVQCWVSAPGIALSARDDLPADPARHVLHGIASRETYLLRFCAAALWSAATYLSRRFPSFGDHLYYHGVSFSAGVGAMMLPWEPRFKKAVLELPTFGHHPLRFLAPSTGSAAAVQQYREDHREVDGVLAYFDAAFSASRIQIPVLVAPALSDPVVPPPGQFAVANALPNKKIAVLQSGHSSDFESIAEGKDFQAEVRTWFDLSPA